MVFYSCKYMYLSYTYFINRIIIIMIITMNLPVMSATRPDKLLNWPAIASDKISETMR